MYQDWMEINNNVLADVRDVIDPYVDWVEVVQHKPNPNGIDARLINIFVNLLN